MVRRTSNHNVVVIGGHNNILKQRYSHFFLGQAIQNLLHLRLQVRHSPVMKTKKVNHRQE